MFFERLINQDVVQDGKSVPREMRDGMIKSLVKYTFKINRSFWAEDYEFFYNEEFDPGSG